MTYFFRGKLEVVSKKEIDPIRIKNYRDSFYKNHLLPHSKIEEKHIFTI